jgi:hypothetical protein
VKPEPLDYATPSKKHARDLPVFATIFGVLFGLVGIFASISGVAGIVWLVQDWKTVDDRDVLGVVCSMLIGAICLFMCVRWIRSAVRYAFDSWAG